MPPSPLSAPQDLQTYGKIVVAIAKRYFEIPEVEDYYKKDAKPLIFTNFAGGSGDRSYGEVTDFKRLTRTLTEVGGRACWGLALHGTL